MLTKQAAVKTHLTAQWIVKTLNQLNDSTLATPTWPNKSHCLSLVDFKVNTVQNLHKTKVKEVPIKLKVKQ